MRLKANERWTCANDACRAEIAVTHSAKTEGSSNPRCCCGSVMKQHYTKPVLTEMAGPADVEKMRRIWEHTKP